MLGSKSRLSHWSPETHSKDSRVLHTGSMGFVGSL